MKLMSDLRSVKNRWTQNFHPTHRAKPEMHRGAKSKTNLAEGPFFETLSTNAFRA